MADKPVVHIGENSPEQVAYRLMVEIANAEGLTLSDRASYQGGKRPDRACILDTYRQCIRTVRGQAPEDAKSIPMGGPVSVPR